MTFLKVTLTAPNEVDAESVANIIKESEDVRVKGEKNLL